MKTADLPEGGVCTVLPGEQFGPEPPTVRYQDVCAMSG